MENSNSELDSVKPLGDSSPLLDPSVRFNTNVPFESGLPFGNTILPRFLLSDSKMLLFDAAPESVGGLLCVMLRQSWLLTLLLKTDSW